MKRELTETERYTILNALGDYRETSARLADSPHDLSDTLRRTFAKQAKDIEALHAIIENAETIEVTN